MKRSEMVKLIESYINDFDFGGNLSHLDYDAAAELLLTKIEESGMKHVTVNSCMCNECNGTEFSFDWDYE